MADPAEAIRWYAEAAELGEELAYLMLGHMNRHTDYGIMNYPEALNWYSRLAEEGEYYSGEGMRWVGHMYLYDDYEMVDYEQAFYWVSESALLGNPGAMFELGIMCYYEDCGMQDLDDAKAWFTMAMEEGYEPAMEMLIELGWLE